MLSTLFWLSVIPHWIHCWLLPQHLYQHPNLFLYLVLDSHFVFSSLKETLRILIQEVEDKFQKRMISWRCFFSWEVHAKINKEWVRNHTKEAKCQHKNLPFTVAFNRTIIEPHLSCMYSCTSQRIKYNRTEPWISALDCFNQARK